ncbi:MAG: ABC1 kinase family protein [Ilumatobacteraceae bacterium]
MAMTGLDGPPTDMGWGAFSETAPWVLERESLTWRAASAQERAPPRRRVPELTTPSRLPPGRRGLVVTARLGAAVLPWLWRRRRSRAAAMRGGSRAFVLQRPWRVRSGLPDPAREASHQDGAGSIADISRRLRLAAEALGPTFIKLGQIISSGDGVFPPELVDEFKRCRDQVPAESFEDVRRTVEEDLGRRIGDVFSWFDEIPLAAASIAQVHAARLHTGEEVVVKVQRPDVTRLVHTDLRAMSWLAPHLVGRIPVAALANPPALVELFADTIVEELDFRIEAANMLDVATMLRDLGQTGYVVPRPHPWLVTRRVLVMQRLDGFKFDDVAGMRDAGVDTEGVVRTAMIALMEGAMIAGIFHGDLHGGNLFVMPDGRTALLDFGIVGRLSDERRVAFLRLMLSATTNDLKGQLAALRDLGALPRDTDLRAVIRDLGLDQVPVDPTTLTGEQLVQEVQRVVKALLGYGARMPKELMLYVKNLVFLDGAIARLAPDLDLLAEIASISMLFAQRHGEQLGRELGINGVEVDLTGVKAGFGVDQSVDRLTHRELQARRRLIQHRMRNR